VAPEFGDFPPAAGRGEVTIAVGCKHTSGGQHVHVGVQKEEVVERLDGDDEARFALRLPGALVEPRGEC
jgi:RNase adaptor protein for sRNA GlmZ degradation